MRRVGVGQERGPSELSWGAREGDSIIAFVRRFKGQGRIQARVGQRRVADGLGCVGEIIQVEVAGRVDARLAVGQGDVERLALSDVTEDQAPRLKTFV